MPPHDQAGAAAGTACCRSQRLVRGAQLADQAARLLADSGELLKRVVDISHSTMHRNHHGANVLRDWSARAQGGRAGDAGREREAALGEARLIAQCATRATLDIGALVGGAAQPWRRHLRKPGPAGPNLSDVLARIVALCGEAERLSPSGDPRQHEVEDLVRTLWSIRELALRNMAVATLSAAAAERIQHEALNFVRILEHA